MTFTDNHPITESELKRLADLGNRELATQGVKDRRWLVDRNGHLTLARTGGA